MSHPYLILFDIDATLLHTDGQGMGAMAAAGERVFGKPFDISSICTAGSLDRVVYRQVVELHQIEEPDVHHQAFLEAYVEELGLVLHGPESRARSLPGVIDIIKTLHERSKTHQDVVLGLLTGNYRDAAPVKLKAVDIDPNWFPVSAFGDEADQRQDLTELAMQRFSKLLALSQPVIPSRVIVIGDTPHDVNCAKAHHCIAFAVGTGRFSVDELIACGADIAVEDLSNPQPLYELLV